MRSFNTLTKKTVNLPSPIEQRERAQEGPVFSLVHGRYCSDVLNLPGWRQLAKEEAESLHQAEVRRFESTHQLRIRRFYYDLVKSLSSQRRHQRLTGEKVIACAKHLDSNNMYDRHKVEAREMLSNFCLDVGVVGSWHGCPIGFSHTAWEFRMEHPGKAELEQSKKFKGL